MVVNHEQGAGRRLFCRAHGRSGWSVPTALSEMSAQFAAAFLLATAPLSPIDLRRSVLSPILSPGWRRRA